MDSRRRMGQRGTVVLALAALLVLAIAVGSVFAQDKPTVSIRLEWIVQGQFAGYLVALDKGYYDEAGVNVVVHPAGPDLKPATMVANGTDDFGIGHPHQIVATREQGVPLVMVAQIFQDSNARYVAKKSTGIEKLEDIVGKRVGLWFGGDEFEFLAMMNDAGISQNDVALIPQKFQITPWLQDQYEVMQVTAYNELLLVYEAGYSEEDLTILAAKDQGLALIGNGIFTTERMIEQRPDVVQAVVEASIRGWQYTVANPEEAARIVLKYAPESNFDHEFGQISAILPSICMGPTLEHGIGYAELESYEVAREVLLLGGVIRGVDDVSEGFTNAFWEATPAEYRIAACGL